MSYVRLAAATVLLVGAVLWVAASSGCGAKSGLLVDDPDATPEPDSDTPELPDCSTDVDCADGRYCNGIERCVDGHCRPGSPIECPGGDACNMAYCDVDRDRCIEVLIAEDQDGDGHYEVPCGQDCDDLNPNVYPGAREECNGIDDDCDGVVDEDLVLECEDFGRQICVGGVWSECMHCTVCIPGTTRYCDTPTYCSWGEQRCNDTGTSWSDCYETSAPSGCTGYGYDQDCCMSVSACCQDWLDYDGDGDYYDSIGTCEYCPAAP